MGSSITYPAPAPSYDGDVATIHRTLKEPATVARRVQQLSDRRFIADFLLQERLQVAGGAITYESGEDLGTTGNPRAVAPGASYPLVSVTGGTPSVAKTTKWGQDAIITDEAIARQKVAPVNRALTKLVNQNVMYIDSIAISAILSAVTGAGHTREVANPWPNADAEQILLDVMLTVAAQRQLELGIDPDTVVLDDVTYAYVIAKFVAAGYLPREGAGNAVTTADFPTVRGMTWVPSGHLQPGTVGVFDRDLLGGMADEDLQSPGYARATAATGGPARTLAPVETKSIRDEDNDRYKVRARRVTVPVVLEPLAGYLLTGTSTGQPV